MQLHIGSTNSVLLTDNSEVLEALDSIYTIPYPGAQFILKKKKNWDGKKHFFNPKTGMFRTGLVPRVLRNLEKISITPEIQYHTKLNNITFQTGLLEKYKLFPDQEKLIEQLLAAGRGICESPTGSGKSVIMAYLIALWNSMGKNRIYVFTARKQLVSQLYKFFDSCLPNVGIAHGEEYKRGSTMVASIGSFSKVISFEEQPDLILVDEIHEFSGGKTSLSNIETIDCYHKFGFTATVPTDKFARLTVEGAFGSVITGETTQSLTAKGRIPVAKINLYRCKHEKYRDTNSYLETYQKKIVKNRERNNLICSVVNSIISSNRDAKILLLVKELAHIEELQKLIPDSIVIQGSDDIQERYTKIKKFLKSKNVIIGTTVMQTGVNIPELTDLINARGLRSEIPTIQALGRMLRGDHPVTIHDFIDECEFLGKHSRERIEAYKQEGHAIHEVTI